METTYSEIMEMLNNISNDINVLKKEINENESLLLELLKANNDHTKKIYEATVEDKSTSQQLKDFGMNVLANIAGNAISTPTIINLK